LWARIEELWALEAHAAVISGYKVHSMWWKWLGRADLGSLQRIIAVSICGAYIILIIAAFVTSLALLFVFQGCFLGLFFGLGVPLYMASVHEQCAGS
jgi:uncharacterized membrane protein